MHVATSVSEAYTIALLVLYQMFNEMLRQRSRWLLVTPVCCWTAFSVLKEKQTNKQTNNCGLCSTYKQTNKQLWTMQYI